MTRPTSPERIVVVGSSCAGKTTLARRLARRLAVPHIELDTLYWLPDWQERSKADFRAQVTHAIAADAWVVDGNYSKVRDLVWNRATTIVWLDYPFLLVLRRAVARTFRRAWTQERLFAGNRESFRRSFFSRDSILLWVLVTFQRRRRMYQKLLVDTPAYPHLNVYRLRTPAAAEAYVERLRRSI